MHNLQGTASTIELLSRGRIIENTNKSCKSDYMPMKNKVKIFLVDDHPIICEGLAQLINQEDDLQVCGDARDASTAMKEIRSRVPDVVIVDISLEGKSGIELIDEIKVFYPDVHVLALSMHVEPLIVERALLSGAKGYVSKHEATAVIIKAIRRVLSGAIYLSDTMSEKLLDNIYGNKVQSNKLLVHNLTQREFEVFRLIGQGMGTRQMAETLNISVKTIEAHRENIKGKLKLKNSRELYNYSLQWLKLSR